jgi:hypothetical protein
MPAATTVEVSHVSRETLDFVFSECLPMIERALKHGAGDSTTVKHIYQQCLSGNLTVWAVHIGGHIMAVVMLSIHEYPAKRSLFVELLAGRKMELWRDKVEELLRDFAKLVNADAIEASCRHGLAKKLMGSWKPKAVLMELL